MNKYKCLLNNNLMRLSFVSIFIPNLYYHTKFVYEDFKNMFLQKTNSSFDKSIIFLSFSNIYVGGIFICFVKSMMYIFPPICIYRYLLAYNYFKKTNDYKYISVLHLPGSSFYMSNNKYILKPFGNLSFKLKI
jgi:hypothetical protein